MSIINIISAIGNNSKVTPLFVRDCCIEVPSKVYYTYNQNRKESPEIARHALRERMIDEYSTSAVWLGGIPMLDWCANKLIEKKGYNPSVNLKLFKEEKYQGLNYNIKKFASLAPDAVADLLKVKKNETLYRGMQAGKIAAALTIPIALMGFIIPKLNFALSRKKMAQNKGPNAGTPSQVIVQSSSMSLKSDSFKSLKLKNKKDVTFTGNMSPTLTNLASSLNDLTTVQKMAITDGGYTVGRVATSRKKNEAIDNAFKLSGMLYLNFVAPKQLEKILDKLSNKFFGMDVNLDPILMADDEFINQIKSSKIKPPKAKSLKSIIDFVFNKTKNKTKKLDLPKSESLKDIIDFIDENPNSLFVKYAEKFKKVKMIENKNLSTKKSKIFICRDPRAYVEEKDLKGFRNDIVQFMESAVTSKDNVAKFVKKAKVIKSTNILLNIGISSLLLAWALPKAQFAFRKLVTGTELEPGLIDDKTKV